jgi:pimeloyl-ACP methyl ester carboxylesterase
MINRRSVILTVISLLVLMPHAGLSQSFDLGEINSAKYKIYIPENWNKSLVMYAHGYEEIGEESELISSEVDEFMEIFTSRGFAFAASAYKHQGLVIKDGIEDTEALRTYFEMTYGKPELCLITGHSMGGIISLATIEKYPSEYDGALPLCGWLSPIYSLLKYGLDLLVTYDYFFGENDGEIVRGEDYLEIKEIRKRISGKPDLATLFAEHFRMKEEDLPDMIGFYQFVLKETSGWAGGLPAGNTNTIYSGFGDNDTHLNRDIRRYNASDEAKEYFIRYHTPTGMLCDPVIALHTTYDEILPVFNYEYYEHLSEIKFTSDLYFQQYVIRDGHCNFTNEEVADSFDDLLRWIKQDIRPEPEYK